MPAINDTRVIGFRQQLQQAGDDPVKLAKLMKEIHTALEGALTPGGNVSINPELATLNTLSGYVTSRLAEALADAATGPAKRFVGIDMPVGIDRNLRPGADADIEIKKENGVHFVQTSPGSGSAGGMVLESMVVRDNTLGGKDLFFPNGQDIKGAQWKSNVRLDDILPQGDARRRDLQNAGIDLDAKRNVLVLAGENDKQPTILFEGAGRFSGGGVTVVCDKCQFVAFEGGGGRMVLEKPVVYLYPTSVQDVTVEVKVDGQFLAQYPKMNDGVWRVKAGPTGEIFDPATERRFPYLFWEATRPQGVKINLEQAHCVPGVDAEKFLERVSAHYALNDRERTDFVSYWLPALEANRYNVVQLLSDSEYEKYASMIVTPSPDSTIRLFMVFQGSYNKVTAGEPALTQRTRTGFTVVEWGGSNLDRLDRA